MIKKITILVYIIFALIACSKDDEPDLPIVLSNQNTINSFDLTINGEIINGTINQIDKTILFSLAGADISALKPSIDYSENANISPNINESQNFNNEVAYTVYAENGDPNIYRVIVNNRPLNSESEILSFSVLVENKTIEAYINKDNKIINFNMGTLDKSSLLPTISISENATISPDITIPQNFEEPVNYTVTAENGDKTEYTIIANMPQISDNSNSSSASLYYIRADLRISGQFLDMDKPGAEIYLYDGSNKYELNILSQNSYSSQENIIEYSLNTKITENIPTYGNYKIVYQTNSIRIESSQFIDILAESAPKFISLNQDSFSYNDILKITGENITQTIAIPSNGSIFQIQNSSNYDYTVNSDKTQATLTLDYYYLFPAYFGNPAAPKTITFWGPGRRIGESFTTIFN
ncbi:DUF5018 domain-containing protein [Polaribacter sp. AHE13PA]|uniref:DUF5018 domain-containing protein n=1 Tax=Polaribacter sp. AHE13PA TaxID=2745562 RepID=UPI001C501D6D|nr:DUF5018 domain-containing protein [Polaribacter sp. AHE13PA]QXP68415.1 DUF5018 domain-containing protein [Polaribacter sp. AHE13PA]